jgi:hypothetical protein
MAIPIIVPSLWRCRREGGYEGDIKFSFHVFMEVLKRNRTLDKYISNYCYYAFYCSRLLWSCTKLRQLLVKYLSKLLRFFVFEENSQPTGGSDQPQDDFFFL